MDADVTIVGYGPVGAMAALCLARAGCRVRVLERGTEAAQLPRAVGLDGESLRSFQRLGFADTIEALCQPPRDPHALAFTTSRREPVIPVEMAVRGRNGWPDLLFFDQPELEIALREIVARDDRIDVRLAHEAIAIDQDTERVRITTRDARGRRTEHASAYAIGCDGASSFVRKAIGVAWESLDYDQDWLVLDITQGPGANLPEITMQVCDPNRLTSYICVKDPNRRWEFQLLPGETREEMLAPAKIRELLDPWIAPEDYALRRAAVYQFHAANADAWRKGRVFLAGDAAHQTPPFLGQGLNAGFRDAVNLGWKIPLVLSGRCGPALLDSYGAERDPHARDLVEKAVAVGKLMETLAAREAGRADPHPPESIDLDPAAPFVPPMRSGAIMEGQRGGTARAGALLRQPHVRPRGGAPVRLDTLLGSGFCVVARDPAVLALRPRSRDILTALGARTLTLDRVELVDGELDRLFEHHPAAIVRPDRYVFGAVDEAHSLDALVEALADALCLIVPEADPVGTACTSAAEAATAD